MKPVVRSVLLEVAGIVGSILAAFAIDAGWDARREQAREGYLHEAIARDLGAPAAVAGGLEAPFMQASPESRRLRTAWARGVAEGDRDPAPARVGTLFFTTQRPELDVAWEEALASGTLGLIDDPDLRLDFAADAAELDHGRALPRLTELQDCGALEPWRVRSTVQADVAFDSRADSLVTESPCRTDLAALAGDPELSTLLSLPREADPAIVRTLSDLDDLVADPTPRMRGP